MDGGRTYKDQQGGQRFRLREDDLEGGLIQSHGVIATVYSAELWDDPAALLALMREDNLDAEISKRETELDSFGLVSRVVSDLAAGFEQAEKEIKAAAVMAKLEELGYGDMVEKDWQHLVTFRLFLGKAHADMLLDCLFQVCNGRARTVPKTYTEIHNLHPKSHAWPKVFLLVETYCGELLDEEKGQHRAFSHTGPQPKVVKTLDVKAIKLLAQEKELLANMTKCFKDVVKHYVTNVAQDGNEEKKMLGNVTLLKNSGRTLWKAAEVLLSHKNKMMLPPAWCLLLGLRTKRTSCSRKS